MPTSTRRFFWLLPAAVGLWLVLLLGALSRGQAGPRVPGGAWPNWLLLLAQGGFAAGVFLYARTRPSPLRGRDFIGLLRGLFSRALGLTAGLGLVYGLERVAHRAAYPLPGNTLATVTYTVGLGLFVASLAYTLYAWRALVLFRGAAHVTRYWSVFEVLLGGVLLLQLFEGNLPPVLRTVVFGGLGIFGVYLAGHQRWVAYLSQRQKWQALALQAGLLGFLVLFEMYFRHAEVNPALVEPASQHTFLVVSAAFAAFYALAGLLVTFFNLPTAQVFEQRRAEILSLQQLSQIIQRGQSAPEIYRALFESSVQTSSAAAAWLDPHAAPGTQLAPNPAALRHQLSEADVEKLRAVLEPTAAHGRTFVDNDLRRTRRLPAAAGAGFGSVAVLPLRGPHFDYGTLYLLKAEAGGFDPDDLSILHTFAAQTVLSLENLQLAQESLLNQRTQDELRIAAVVQEQLIPKKLPTDDWFEISSFAQAAKEVGGDFYDFLHLPGRQLAVIVGDVSGKGVTAAFHTAQMKGIFHALMQENPLARGERDKYPDPRRFMVQANQALTHCLERSSFITAAFFLIDYEHGGFSFARAGHCHTLYYHSIKEEVSYFRSAGLGLGIIRDGSYEKHIKNQFWDYNPGDVMVIYTDGIVEARNADGDEYGEERLQRMLGTCYYLSAEEINACLRQDVQDFSRGQPLHDDQTLLVIKFKAAQPH